jgi:hypothetical protein
MSGLHNSKTPEGPPPWALQGYKPDPSLPPDQQIIPTLAKKLQQDQWERDGLSASVYDRDLRPLKVYDAKANKSPTADNEEQEPSWPLPDPSPQEEEKPKSPPPPAQPADAGYRTMPSVRASHMTPRSCSNVEFRSMETETGPWPHRFRKCHSRRPKKARRKASFAVALSCNASPATSKLRILLPAWRFFVLYCHIYRIVF